ncbi:phosphatase PAP2 family protein [Sphingomonas sp. MA1305]|uniref:phosphatase PAP2 family protein n=1 Tax=Sphingomonas sp. MA1305 TaxID=2479204 RepID=UPI001E62C976|nr:phosphatase PAP2 family protein [Sphingomonas sp. MA1305]
MLALLLALAAAQADKAASMLGATDLDPARVLPPPPAPGSAQARAELAELRTRQASRTAQQKDAAERTGETKNATIFAGVLGPRFDLARLPATARLLAIVRATEKEAIDRGKDHFARQRPWIVDPSLTPCKLGKEPLSSYPSGHATNAYAMAAVLAQLVPAKAPALMARAAEYAETRITCEQHWRSDLTAGEAFGLLLAERLMAKPAFRAVFTQAQVELAAAGIR